MTDDAAPAISTAHRRCETALGRNGGDIRYRRLPASTWDRASAALLLDQWTDEEI